MILGYYLQGQDNDSYLNADLYEKNISECLDFIRNREKYISDEFKIKKMKYEFSYTYDGALIVSRRFMDLCKKIGIKGINFFQLKNQQELFLIKVINTVEFDCNRRNTQFLEFNESCGEYKEVVGASPVCLKENQLLDPGFYRTNIEFGRGYAKSPLLLVDTNTYNLIKKEKFKGLYGEKILDKYDWEK